MLFLDVFEMKIEATDFVAPVFACKPRSSVIADCWIMLLG